MIHSSVKRWGNSPAVRIPATLMQALNLNIDDEVKIDLVDGKIVVNLKGRQVKLYGSNFVLVAVKTIEG